MRASLMRWSTLAILLVSFTACAREGAKESVSKAADADQLDLANKSPSNVLTLGAAVTGSLALSDARLSDGSHYDLWTYQGRRGERIQISMESNDFDPYLMLGREAGGRRTILQEDDDGGAGLNSLLIAELPEDGEYVIVANSYAGGETGTYTLRIDAQEGARRTGPAPTVDWAARYPGGGDPRGKYALVVGIDDYRGIGNSLRGPVADARLIGRILVERYGFRRENVIELVDRDATREHIAQAFLRHLGQAGPDGVAVFYYSGHGVQTDSNYALGGDLDPEPDGVDEALYVWGADGRGAMVLDDELGFLADRIQTNRMLFIIDACFSGTGTRGGTGGQSKEMKFDSVRTLMTIPTAFLTDTVQSAARGGERKGVSDLMREPQRHLLLAASSDEQLSWTASGWPRYGGTISVFTYYLAEALESAAASATFSDVAGRVRDQTDSYTQRRYNARQTPQAEGRAAGQRIRDFLAQR